MSRKQRAKRARAKSATKRKSPMGPRSESNDRRPEVANGSGVSPNKLGVIVAVLALAALFGLVLYLGDAPPPPPASEAEASDAPDEPPLEQWRAAPLEEIPVSDRDFSRGPENAPVTIVEFSDFECPFCQKASVSLEAVQARYPEDVRLVYKNFPLDTTCNSDMTQQLHPSACKAAIMARCAGRRDREMFWQFHDAIFLRDSFDPDALDDIAEELGLASESFSSCVASGEVFDEVREDIELALLLDVTATPTLFINGRAAPSYEEEDLAEIIDHIIATK